MGIWSEGPRTISCFPVVSFEDLPSSSQGTLPGIQSQQGLCAMHTQYYQGWTCALRPPGRHLTKLGWHVVSGRRSSACPSPDASLTKSAQERIEKHQKDQQRSKRNVGLLANRGAEAAGDGQRGLQVGGERPPRCNPTGLLQCPYPQPYTNTHQASSQSDTQ